MARVSLPKKKDYHTLRRWLQEHKHLSSKELSRLSGITLNKICIWMVQCDVIDINDGELLKVWTKYKNYSAAESCVVLGVSHYAFRKALNRHKIDRYRIKPQQKNTEPILELPRDKDTFQSLFNKYGVNKLSKITGFSIPTIKKIRYRHNVTNPRSNKFSKKLNDCNNKNWLIEHYVNRKMSLRKCAKLARVSPHTIRNWLINYEIVPRPKTLRKNATLQAGIA